MATINPSFQALCGSYIFTQIEEKLASLEKEVPRDQILNFGIGDVALPLAPAVAKSIVQATQEMTTEEGIHGYGPSDGYPFLKMAISQVEFFDEGIGPDEIFISDGANSDVVNILDLFAKNQKIGIMSPSYPVYAKGCILHGHEEIVFLACLEENGFLPKIPEEKLDLIYLCTPNNPTGIAFTRGDLKKWVTYARKHGAILLVDAAYSAFIRSPDVPKSIFEIEGAKECAIEFRSFSKSAGFTALRCGYTVIPKELVIDQAGKEIALGPVWKKRQGIKNNGVCYPVQRGAEASLFSEGRVEVTAQVASYLELAAHLKTALLDQGFTCYGGVDSPYLWLKNPPGVSSWDFFEFLLKEFHLLSIPGVGFGEEGEGFVRFSCFSTKEKVDLAIQKLSSMKGDHAGCSI